jgi:hypothetical protein
MLLGLWRTSTLLFFAAALSATSVEQRFPGGVRIGGAGPIKDAIEMRNIGVADSGATAIELSMDPLRSALASLALSGTTE